MSAHCVGATTDNIMRAMELFQSQLLDEKVKLQVFDDVWFIGEISAQIINKKIKANQGK